MWPVARSRSRQIHRQHHWENSVSAREGRAGRQDTSQKGNYCNFRNETLNKSPVTVDKLFLDEKP